jgi:serine protease DegS
MKKLIAFIFWPALAGLIFAVTLLQAPRLVRVLPGLAAYFPSQVQVVSSSPQTSYSDAIRKAAPAVVSINYQHTVERTREVYIDRFTRGNLRYEDVSNSLGSGVIISPDGYIITSYHILFNPELEGIRPDALNVTLNDGRTLTPELMGLDEKNDLALLKIDAGVLPYLKAAETGELLVGDVVLAIGNPRNIGQSVTQGIISALWSRDDSFVIQTDAAINPGNSGGALINVEGDLIGINSTIVSESGGSEGIGFAIPADLAIALHQNYLIPSGYLGVDTKVLSLETGRAYYGQDIEGFLVEAVAPDSPASKAGIQKDDIITGVNDEKLRIRSEADMGAAFAAIDSIRELEPGAFITIEVYRNGELIKLPTVLGAGVPRMSFADPEPQLVDPATTVSPPPPVN